jgi:hypothetical protein
MDTVTGLGYIIGAVFKPIHIAAFCFFAVATFTVAGCTGASGQRAAEGAGTGAIAGAAAGLVGALLWGGNPAESMAKSAVVGGVVGGVSGGVSGSRQDAAKQRASQQSELQVLQTRMGPDAYAGAVALAECKHGVAEANARVAADSTDSTYALAGLWIEAMSRADRGDLKGAETLYPEIVRWDRSVGDEQQAAAELQASLIKLQDVRQQYELPRTCKS